MKKFIDGMRFAFKGIRAAFATESNVRFQGIIAVIVIVTGLYVHLQTWEWVAVLFCIALVLGLELMNTAVENLVDLVTLERNPLAGNIKDIAAGAVTVAAIIAAVIGILIFYPHFF